MQKLKDSYRNVRAPQTLQARLINDYDRAQHRVSNWPISAPAFALLFVCVVGIWLYQPNGAPPSQTALGAPVVMLSPAAAGLPRLTAQAGRFSALSLSELSAPAVSEFNSLPTLPGVPPRPSS